MREQDSGQVNVKKDLVSIENGQDCEYSFPSRIKYFSVSLQALAGDSL